MVRYYGEKIGSMRFKLLIEAADAALSVQPYNPTTKMQQTAIEQTSSASAADHKQEISVILPRALPRAAKSSGKTYPV